MPLKQPAFCFCIFIPFLLFITAFLLLAQVGAAQELFSRPESDQHEPWELFAAGLKVNRKLKIVEAEGDVHLQHKNDVLQADYARYYWETGWIYLQGNVYAELDQDILRAREAEFDLQNRVGWLKQGQIFISEPHMYVSGQNLQKTGQETYSFEQAKVTTCDEQKPAWSLRTSQGEVTLEGYAHLHRPRFQIKDRPLLYFPYLVLPVKQTRQSGLLRPEYYSSSRDGTGINLPYFQVINQEQDLTFYLNYMSQRGFMPGLEYRLNPDPWTKGLFRMDWVQDQVRFDSYPEPDPDKFPKDRFWLRGKLDGFILQPEWQAILDLDYVSDQYYLREFKSGYSGFTQSREEFLHEFGRDIANKDSLRRKNLFVLSRNWSDFGLQGRLEYDQNPEYQQKDKDSSTDPTLQRLPELHFDFFRSDLSQSPLQWEARNQITNFWRRAEDEQEGVRLDLHPRLFWPLRSGFGSLLPSLGRRQTMYYAQDKPQEMQDDYHQRGIWDVHVSAFSELFRIFDLPAKTDMEPVPQNSGNSAWSKIRHSLQPELEYTYIPDKDQSDLPEFDGLDRIEAQNKLDYSLKNVLTRRLDSVRLSPDNQEIDLHKDYLDFLELELRQSYDLREADRDTQLDEYPRRPFSDIRARLLLRPLPGISLQDSTWVSPYTGNITEHEHMLRLNHQELGQAYFGLDYRKELDDIQRQNQQALRILRTGGRLEFDSWSMLYDLEQDLQEHELIRQRMGVAYKHQCWNIELNYIQSPEEDRVELSLSLYQLGEIEQPIFTAPR